MERMSQPPNILLITADQLRYDCLGSSGHYLVRTPNLDELGREGAVFTNAYSHFPVCCPARQSMLHGRRPETFGALWNFNTALPVASLQPDDFTWSKALAEQGYTSAYLGKWGVHPDLDASAFGYGTVIGEERYTNFLETSYPGINYTGGVFGEANPVPLEDSHTHWFAKRGIEELERLQSEEGPWHLALHFSEPHLPCRPSEPYADMYDPAGITPWPSFGETFENKPYIQKQHLINWGVEHFTWEDWAPIVARYLGIVSQLDEAIGRVLKAVHDENTLVIFTADHGDMGGSHRMFDKHYVLYDDVIRVPLLMRWKGVIPPGTKRSEFVYNFLDLPPTLLEAAGNEKEAPFRLQGESLLPLLNPDVSGEVNWRTSVVSSYNGQHFGLFNQRMLRTDRFKYIWNMTDIDELYDLEKDSAELKNEIRNPAYSEILKELRAGLYEQLQLDGDGVARGFGAERQLLGNVKITSH
ncbi:Arylsulfatase [compost metagenome]